MNPTFLAVVVASALPILLPAAILWRIEQPVPRLTEPLVAGSIAVAASVLLTTLASGFEAIFRSDQGPPTSDPVAMAVPPRPPSSSQSPGRSPIGRAILALRGAEPARWAFWAGFAIVALTVGHVAYYLYEAWSVLGPQIQTSTVPMTRFARTQAFPLRSRGSGSYSQYLAWVVVRDRRSRSRNG